MRRPSVEDGPAPDRRGTRVLFLALANDIGVDRLPAAMGKLGAECAVLCPPGYYCTTSRFVRQWFRLPRHRGLWLGIPFIRTRLEAAVRSWQATLIVPLDNVAAQFLRVITKSLPATSPLRHVLETSLGAPGGYADACSRSGLMRMAEEIGVAVPRFCVSRDPALMLARAEAWGYPVVLKAENTCGGHGVTIASNPEELRAAMAELRGGTLWRRVRGRLRDRVWSLAGLRETAGAPPILQAFARGVPAMRTVSAWRGEVLDGASFVAERTHPGPTGPSTVVRYIENAAMDAVARRLVAALGCSGFLSFDFMFDDVTGEVALIEMNPRPIGTTHLGRMFGHDACAPLLSRVDARLETPRQPQAATIRTVALFPKEIEREPTNLWRLRADDIHHDVPYDEPAIIAAYLRRLSAIHPAELPGIIDSVTPLGGAQPPLVSASGGRPSPDDRAAAFDARPKSIGGPIGVHCGMPPEAVET
jgi:hypothetical protein